MTESSTHGPPPKRLTRSSDKRIAGVAGGIAEYFGIDPTVVRLLLLALVLFGGGGILLYLIAWLVLPPPGGGERGASRQIALVLAAVVLAAAAAGGQVLWVFGWDDFGTVLLPVALLALAFVLLTARDDTAAEPTSSSSVEPSPMDAGSVDPGVVEPAGQSRSSEVAVATEQPLSEPAVPVAGQITAVTLAILAVFAGLATAGDLAGWWNLHLVAAFGIAVGIVGVALCVSAFVGRAVGLVVLGVVLALGMLAATVIDPLIDHGVGERVVRVSDPRGLEPTYELGVGRLELDLRDVALQGEVYEIDVSLDIGEAVVIVPRDVEVLVDGEVAAGELQLFGVAEGGIGVERTTTNPGDAGRLILHLDVGAGRGEVRTGA